MTTTLTSSTIQVEIDADGMSDHELDDIAAAVADRMDAALAAVSASLIEAFPNLDIVVK